MGGLQLRLCLQLQQSRFREGELSRISRSAVSTRLSSRDIYQRSLLSSLFASKRVIRGLTMSFTEAIYLRFCANIWVCILVQLKSLNLESC